MNSKKVDMIFFAVFMAKYFHAKAIVYKFFHWLQVF